MLGPLTICIGAISEQGEKVVVAADRMFTAQFPLNVEFETAEQKIEKLAPTCVGLSSGGSAYAQEVFAGTRDELEGNIAPIIADVAEIVKEQYIRTRLRVVNETVILPALGSDFMAMQEKGASLPVYLQSQPATYVQLLQLSSNHNIELDILVAGIDATGAHIWLVTHPGTALTFDKLGFGAIGSGAVHALNKLYLSQQTSKTGFWDTLYAVYRAKVASEVAPGVGKATDIMVVKKGEESLVCSEAVKRELQHVVEENENKRASIDLSSVQRVFETDHPPVANRNKR